MSDEKETPKPVQLIQKIQEINAGKAVALDGEGKQLREGVKPSAPANFTLPEPVKMPLPTAAASIEKPTANTGKSEKE
jgi:hypothetical protein